jgi:hypothetical protein
VGILDLRLTLHAHGDAPPEVVWDRYADVPRWANWSPHIVGVECAGTTLKAGLSGEVIVAFGMHVPFEVVEVGIRRWAWEVHPFGLRIQLDHRVLPRLDGAATELRMRGPAPAVLASAPFAKLALRKLVRW